MADQTNPWGSARQPTAPRRLPTPGVAPLLPRRLMAARRLAAQRPGAAAGTVQYHGSVP